MGLYYKNAPCPRLLLRAVFQSAAWASMLPLEIAGLVGLDVGMFRECRGMLK